MALITFLIFNFYGTHYFFNDSDVIRPPNEDGHPETVGPYQ